MAWTFGGVAFFWMRDGATVPTWNRQPRLNIRPLLGLGDADISRVGYEPYTLSGEIYVLAANVDSLLALNGTSGALTDGTTTWTAVLTAIEVNTLVVAAEGVSGTATFVRPRATG